MAHIPPHQLIMGMATVAMDKEDAERDREARAGKQGARLAQDAMVVAAFEQARVESNN